MNCPKNCLISNTDECLHSLTKPMRQNHKLTLYYPTNIHLVPLILFAALVIFIQPAWSASVTISWNRNQEPDIAGYVIYWRTEDEKAYSHSKVISDTAHYPVERSFTLEGLEAGHTYYFAITAFDLANQESEFSDEIIKTIADEGADKATDNGEQFPSHSYSLVYLDSVAGEEGNSSSVQAATGDINGDGYEDVIFLGHDGFYVSLSDGTQLTQPSLWYSFSDNNSLSESMDLEAITNGWQLFGCGDMNADGYDDLIMINRQTGRLAINFTSYQGIDHEIIVNGLEMEDGEILGPADFDGNGYNDLLYHDRKIGLLSFWLFDGNGLLNTSQSTLFINNPLIVFTGIGDYDRNGTADLLLNINPSYNMFVTLNTHNVDFDIMQGLENPYQDLIQGSTVITSSGDFNGDGLNDIVTLNPDAGVYELWILDGYTLNGPITLMNYIGNLVFFDTADINNDGIADMIFRVNVNGGLLCIMSGD